MLLVKFFCTLHRTAYEAYDWESKHRVHTRRSEGTPWRQFIFNMGYRWTETDNRNEAKKKSCESEALQPKSV